MISIALHAALTYLMEPTKPSQRRAKGGSRAARPAIPKLTGSKHPTVVGKKYLNFETL